MSVTEIIEGVLAKEGEAFTNDPRDSGGPTKWGITQATLSEFLRRPASVDEVRELSRMTAADIYEWQYVRRPRFHEVLALDERIGEELIDTGVNCGVAVAAMFLQRALNALNLNGTLYPDIDVDGACGPATLGALRAFLARRGFEGRRVLHVALNCLQGERYIELAEKRPKDEAFVYGWLRARVST